MACPSRRPGRILCVRYLNFIFQGFRAEHGEHGGLPVPCLKGLPLIHSARTKPGSKPPRSPLAYPCGFEMTRVAPMR
jgi:hypothetical protein